MSDAMTRDTLGRKEAALYLSRVGYPIAHATLASLASRGKGPPFVKFMGRKVLYLRGDLDAWALSQTRPGLGHKPLGA